MVSKNIDSLTVAKGTCCPGILAKREILLHLKDIIVWESCSMLRNFQIPCLLDAFSHLYERVCPSVGPSVGLSIGLSVRRSHTS